MGNTLSNFVNRGRFVVLGLLFAFSIASTGVATLANPVVARADSCDPVNIILCGLDQRSLGGSIRSFQASYNNGSNNDHNDLKAVYRWAGATDANVKAMNTSNTKLGTLYKNGDIKVNGKVVGTNASVAARFGAGRPGFTKIPNTDGAYARKTTTSFARNSAPVIVHFTQKGIADFAVMTDCGNAVKFPPKPPKPTPPQPQPKAELACVNLAGSQVEQTRAYMFTAQAHAKNTTITKYVFSFGDGTNKTVRTSEKKATASHTYSNSGATARVTVYSKDFKNGKTGSDCVFKIPKITECKPGIPKGSKKCEETPPTLPPSKGGEGGTTPPRELAHTGAGAVIGLFGATVVSATIGHYLFTRRRLE